MGNRRGAEESTRACRYRALLEMPSSASSRKGSATSDDMRARRTARLHLRSTLDRACLTVADDGAGFPFQGCYDRAARDARNVGPASLRKRVASLGGELELTSEPSGSRLDISLPLERLARPRPIARSAAA